MVSQFQKRKKRISVATSFLGIIIFTFISVAVVYLIFSNIKINQKREKLNSQVAAIRKEAEDFKNKNESLKEKISNVGDQDYIEKVAREELNYQKEGEKVIGFVLPPEQSEQEQKNNLWQPNSWWRWFGEKWQWLKNKF